MTVDMIHDQYKDSTHVLNINFLIIFLYLSFRILPERFLAVLKRKINVRFDAVIGYKVNEQ